MSRRRKWTIGIVAVLFVVIAAGFLYIADYYPAQSEALEVIKNPGAGVEVTRLEGQIVFVPEHATAGFVFYPGGKVAYEAYAPLMNECAERGILCVLIEMPGNLAVFDIDAAEGVADNYPQITEWYIGGHSLGGSMAASYLEAHAGEFEGIVLLASYSTANLREKDLVGLTVYGSEDQVLNREKYQKNQENLPSAYEEVVIVGGNHAQFGMYGEQEGDGTATISNQDQIEQTADVIAQFIEP